MSLFKTLKRNSRLALKGNWGRAIFVLFIFFAVMGLLSGAQQYAFTFFENLTDPVTLVSTAVRPVSSYNEIAILSIFTFLGLLLLLPLEMGVCKWFYCLVSGKPSPISETFVFFENIKKYGKSLWLYMNILSLALLWSILFFIFPTVVSWLSTGLVNGYYSIYGDARLNAAAGTVGVILGSALYVLAAICYIICMNRYALAIYILFDGMDNHLQAGMNTMSTREIIKTSVRYSKGYRLNIFLFQLSFLGWAALCIFIVPIFFLAPYYFTSFSMFARYIVEKSHALEALEETDFIGEMQPAYTLPFGEEADTGGNKGGVMIRREENATVEEPTTQIHLNDNDTASDC